ncbi:MAG: hypothetical protein IRZ09_01315 [Variibacter sp.]|nr:hypothetical protein [Variibacter sp.]
MIRAAFAAFAVALLAIPAGAQSPAPDSENGRYTFNQTPDGLLRLDTRTGHVSICNKRAVGWACEMVPDERSALETEINRLQNENVTLKRELISRGIPLPSGSRAPEKSGARQNELVLKLPSDADLDRAMSFFEKLWRRLIEMVQSMQKEQDKKG